MSQSNSSSFNFVVQPKPERESLNHYKRIDDLYVRVVFKVGPPFIPGELTLTAKIITMTEIYFPYAK